MQDTIVEKVLSTQNMRTGSAPNSSSGVLCCCIGDLLGFILTLAYMPEVFAQPLGAGWTMVWGFCRFWLYSAQLL